MARPTLRQSAVVAGAVLLALAGAGAAPAADPPPPRTPAGLLSALAQCRANEDYACVDRLLTGSELITRVARAKLRAPGGASDPDFLPALLANADAGGRRRFLTLLKGPLDQCDMALSLAAEALCHVQGQGRRAPPERDVAGLPAKARAALEGLDRHLGAGLRHRRVRRLVCGPYADLSGTFRFAAATLVLADCPGTGPTILDLACHTLNAGGPTHRTPVPLAKVVEAPDSEAVVAAVDRGLHCLEDGGRGCLDAVAPFGRLLHAWLVSALDADRADREAALTRARGLVAGDPGDRASFLLHQLQVRCGDLTRLTAGDCRAGAATPAPAAPPLPRRLGPSEAARARALEALAGARAPTGPLEVRHLACGDLRATVTLVRPTGGLPALVDLTCR